MTRLTELGVWYHTPSTRTTCGIVLAGNWKLRSLVVDATNDDDENNTLWNPRRNFGGRARGVGVI